MKKLYFLLILLAGMSQAQTTVAPASNPHFQLFNGSAPCSGCLLDSFSAGTTTPLVTYSESTGTTPNANPVVADSNGFVTVYFTSASYKLRLRTSGGATIWTQDNVSWLTPLTTFSQASVAGNFTQTQPTAATGGANQSSFNDCMNGNYWTGSVSATDQWCLNDTLGSGSNPTSTFTMTHSGSSGAATFSVPSAAVSMGGNVSVGGTLGVTGESTLQGLLSPVGFSVGKQVRSCQLPAPLGDGLVADGVTNDRTALNNCLANAYTNGQNVQLPSGKIHISGGAINDTNKPGMNIAGTWANEDFSTLTSGNDFGTGITQIMCDTGTVCWDATGSGGQEIKHIALRIANSYSTPSTFGFLFGRDNAVSNGSSTGLGTYCFSANDVLDNVWVFTDSNPAATAIGRIAVENQGAETFTVRGGGYIANVPFHFGTSNNLSLSSPFQTLGTGCPQSMTEVHMFATNLGTYNNVALRFDDQIINFSMDSATELQNESPGVNHNAAIFLNASSHQSNLFLQGQVENFDFPILLGQNVNRAFINLMVGGNNAGMIQPAANNLSITNSNISFDIENGTAVPLINSTGCTGCTIKGSIINEAGLTGSGTGASGTAVTTSTIYADGITDANVNTFQSGSQYDLFNGNGRSFVGANKFIESTAPSAVSGSDVCYGDSTAHAIECSYNNGSFFRATQTIGTGTVTTAGTAVTNGTCQAQTGITITGSLTTDQAVANINAALPATWQTGIRWSAEVSAGGTCTVNLCNPTAGSITPAATAVRCTVTR